MRTVLAILIAAAGLAFSLSAAPAAAQTMDVAAVITSPQSGVSGLEGRTFGYGVSATVAYPYNDVVRVVGTLQYHNHNRAEVRLQDLEFLEGQDRDFVAGVGVRLERWGLYIQGLGGFTQKRDALIDTENDTKPSALVGWGYQPGHFGVAGGWYFSDFGTQYAAGVNLRF